MILSIFHGEISRFPYYFWTISFLFRKSLFINLSIYINIYHFLSKVHLMPCVPILIYLRLWIYYSPSFSLQVKTKKIFFIASTIYGPGLIPFNMVIEFLCCQFLQSIILIIYFTLSSHMIVVLQSFYVINMFNHLSSLSCYRLTW